MNGKYLLDTNIVIALFDQEPAVEKRLNAESGVSLPSIVLGELYFGAVNSTRAEQNLARIDDFAASCSVIPVNAAVALQYGAIKVELKKKGRPIPENDIWIAACARAKGWILVSRDRHFAEIESLQVEAW